MASLYQHPEIYDMIETPQRWDMHVSHWQTVLQGKPVHTLLDVSIGTGSLTLPLTDLGISVQGSDLSPEMLARCREKAVKLGGSSSSSPGRLLPSAAGFLRCLRLRRKHRQLPSPCTKSGTPVRP